jgi:hypothetical protein
MAQISVRNEVAKEEKFAEAKLELFVSETE